MLSLTIASADLALKSAITGSLPIGTVIPLTSFFNLVHFWNTGAAFSFLADAGGWQRYFFIVIALVVSMMLALILRRPRANSETLVELVSELIYIRAIPAMVWRKK